MGPSRLFHKNRSQHSLINTQDAHDKRYQTSPIESPLHSPGFPPPPSQYDGEEDPDQGYSPYSSEEARYYQLGQPTRSQSQRSPVQINTNVPQPTINLVGPAHSTPNSAIDEPPDRYYRQREEPNPPAQKEDRKKRRFFGLGGVKEPAPRESTPAQRLGRSISVRRKEQPPETYQDAGRQQQHWSEAHISPTEDYEEEDEGGAGLHPSTVSGVPPPVEKDPLRSPALPPPISHQEYTQVRSPQHKPSSSQSVRHPTERSGSYHSSWERAVSSVHHHTQASHGEPSQQTPSSYHPSPSSATSTSSHSFHHKSPQETLPQPLQEYPSRPSSQQSLEPPLSREHTRPYEPHHVRASSSQASSASYLQGSMGPPSQNQNPGRRPSEAQSHTTGEQGREAGGYQPYAQTGQGSQVLPSNAPPQYSAQLAPQGQVYRSGNQPSPMQQQGGADERRGTTPPPSRSQDNLSSLDVAQLLSRHDELRMSSHPIPRLASYPHHH